MKVSELIIELQKLNQDKEIVFVDMEYGFCSIDNIMSSDIWYKQDDRYFVIDGERKDI